MIFKDLHSKRFQLKILTPELVTNTYLNWFLDLDASKFIINRSNTLDSLRIYCLEKLRSDTCLFFGIFYKNTHIGNIKFEPINFEERSAVLGVLIGDNKWRGKGVFKEVFLFISLELKKMGITTILLGVDINNLNAIESYLKIGFTIIESDEYQLKMRFNLI